MTPSPAASPAVKPNAVRLAVLLVLLALVLVRFIEFEASGSHMDEGVLLVYPELILSGKVPYRDFETFYGPMNLWVLAGAYRVFGAHILVERAVGFATFLALLLGVFTLARRGGIVTGITSMFLAAVFTQTMGVVAFAWMGAVACLLWSLILLSKPGLLRVFGAGLLAAAGLLYRPDLAPALLALLPMLWQWAPRMRWRFALGFCLGMLPMALLTLIAGVRPVIENLFLYPVVYSNPGRRLPLAMTQMWCQSVFWAHLAACAINVSAGVKAWLRRNENSENALLLSAGLLGLLMTHQSLQRSDEIHVCMSAFISLSLLPWAITSILRRSDGPQEWRGAIVSTAVVALMMTVALPAFVHFFQRGRYALRGDKLISISIQHGGREFPVGSLQACQFNERILAYLETNAKPGERLFVGPSDMRRTNYCSTYFYHLLPKLEPATYFLEMNPLSANRPGSRLAADVATADWLILDDSFNDWDEPNASVNFGSNAPNDVVWQQFKRVLDLRPLHVLRRKTAGPAGEAPLAVH